MNIVEEIEAEYRSKKNYGIQFNIEPEAYDCDIPDERIEFGDNTTSMQGGALYNWQDIILDGNVIGYLEERQTGKLFDPMTSTFVVFLADCSEPEKITPEMEASPHFFEDKTFQMRFATLQQMIDYLRQTKAIC